MRKHVNKPTYLNKFQTYFVEHEIKITPQKIFGFR